jgi:hypothetical protein
MRKQGRFYNQTIVFPDLQIHFVFLSVCLVCDAGSVADAGRLTWSAVDPNVEFS